MMSKSPKHVYSLKHFILKGEVKNLYRQFLKTARQVPDKNYRDELKKWIQTDFRNNANTTDEYAIKMLIQNGKKSLQQLKISLNLAK
ncbi:LYR motif-containing protein 2 [Agrilus planipennis]|uniref:LYR motif-containing protein 2 n=1 Tax=Agrilus planipennis TaxID=224129 RepID=A0A1W4X8N7_AGRPL|nr:LYR motif-containing protein 2 [Agrilus planipennis]